MSLLLLLRKRDLSCIHSNSDLLTREDNCYYYVLRYIFERNLTWHFIGAYKKISVYIVRKKIKFINYLKNADQPACSRHQAHFKIHM